MKKIDASKLELVKEFAVKAHGQQRRKYADEPYIVHLERVMEICKGYTDDVAILSAALLHDVLEDTDVTPEELKIVLNEILGDDKGQKCYLLVRDLTDEFVKSNYPALNRRARKFKESLRLATAQPDAQTIKYADIIDNINDIVKHETDFALVYIRESKSLLQHIPGGNATLYERALHTVDDALQAYWRKANVKAL
jgi:guanosine-3',5'-bis(diphosphate) 3'-pyrophosphohydrolase